MSMAERFPQRMIVMPSGVLFDLIEGRLSETDLRVAAAMGTMSDRNGWIRDTRQNRIAERAGFGRQTVNRSLTRLEEAGWVKRVDAGKPNGVMSYLMLFDRRALEEGPDAPAGEADPKKTKENNQQEPPVAQPGDTPCRPAGRHVAAERHPPVAEPGDTPCRSSGDTIRVPFTNKSSPLPPSFAGPAPPACTGPDGRCASGRRSKPGSAGSNGGEPGANAAAPCGEAETGAAKGAGGSAREGGGEAGSNPPGTGAAVSAEDWRALRQAARKTFGQRFYADCFGRLRMDRSGRLIAPSRASAADVAAKAGGWLKQAGFAAIYCDLEGAEVSL